jgi:phage head maturation protease
MAWQSVTAKLVRGVSIGFRALKYDIMSEGGLNFKETEIYELSLVTIPANAQATIQTIKAMDTRLHRAGPVRLLQPKINKEVPLIGGAVRLIQPK